MTLGYAKITPKHSPLREKRDKVDPVKINNGCSLGAGNTSADCERTVASHPDKEMLSRKYEEHSRPR